MGNPSNVWFIADTHFGHSKIIEYCNRPFPNADIMDFNMIQRWNEVVWKDDKVYHLGDFALGNKEQVASIVEQLNGKIYLVKGNHDTRPNQWYRDCGFAEVYDHPIIIMDYLVLSHEPLPFVMNQMYCSAYGHIHNSPLYKTWGKNSACMCVERHNYYPVNLETIKKHFVEGV
jgi:calcineurin-like phosphoesterase family protein